VIDRKTISFLSIFLGTSYSEENDMLMKETYEKKRDEQGAKRKRK